jgi:hypothetical protein
MTKREHRRFTAEQKLEILREADVIAIMESSKLVGEVMGARDACRLPGS